MADNTRRPDPGVHRPCPGWSAPGGNRNPNHRLRRPVLYPVELQARACQTGGSIPCGPQNVRRGTSDPEHSRDQDPDEDRNQQRDADAPDRQVVDAPQDGKPMAAELAGEPAFALETAVWTLTHKTALEPTSGGPPSLSRGTNHPGRPSPAHTHGRTYRARTGAATCRTDMAFPAVEPRSGRRDSNPGPPAPKAGALPDCATPRTS